MTRIMVTYRLDEEIINGVKARAKTDSRTITAVVGLALKQYLDYQGSDSKPVEQDGLSITEYADKYGPGQVKRGDE